MAKRSAIIVQRGLRQERFGHALLRTTLALIMATPLVMHFGWPADDPLFSDLVIHWLQVAALVLYAAGMLAPELPRGLPAIWRHIKSTPIETAAVVVGLAGCWDWIVLLIAVAILVVANLSRAYAIVVHSASISPALVFVASFVSIIFAGAGLLKLPVATPDESPITLVDAAFTSTSAVCVTGLIVRDTATEFTRFGQSVILALIQLGGLGIIVFGALLAIFLGSGFGLRVSQAMSGATGQEGMNPVSIRRLIAFIVLLTLATEAVGAVALYLGWPREWTGGPEVQGGLDRAFHCAFFSVSAFCNAGFVTASNSLEGLRTHWTSHVVIAGLIVIGGLGFPALNNLREVGLARLRRERVSGDGLLVRFTLHTKLVLTVTVVLYLLGVAAIFAGRLIDSNDGVALAALDAHFMSITPRTAGFDTLNPAEMGPLSRLATMVFMFVGGSPGSTAGGVKTIVIATLFLTIWATITGRPETRAFGRVIPETLVRKAATLITLGFLSIAALTAVLSVTEARTGGPSLEELLFESVSACSTVGLSMGVTAGLSDAGKVAVMVGMFLGRVGPLVVLAAVVSVGARRQAEYHYATEGAVIS